MKIYTLISGGLRLCYTKRILHECSCFIEFFNELRKSDKMRGLPSILSFFCNEFNKLNNTRARILDYIYHMT